MDSKFYYMMLIISWLSAFKLQLLSINIVIINHYINMCYPNGIRPAIMWFNHHELSNCLSFDDWKEYPYALGMWLQKPFNRPLLHLNSYHTTTKLSFLMGKHHTFIEEEHLRTTEHHWHIFTMVHFFLASDVSHVFAEIWTSWPFHYTLTPSNQNFSLKFMFRCIYHYRYHYRY